MRPPPRTQVFVLVACAAGAVAAQVPQPARAWGPEQALGAPDTPEPGDQPSAWASKSEDDQPEWLEVGFAEPIVPLALRIVESFHPGALSRIEVLPDGGDWTLAWEGADPTSSDELWGVSVVPLLGSDPIRRARLHLDSPAVVGWNEIDAVGLHGLDGSLRWAVEALASSTFAAGVPRSTGFAPAASERAATLPEPAGGLAEPYRTVVDGVLEVFRELRLSREPADDPGRAAAALAAEIVRLQRGKRADGRSWLCILESPWQEGLAEPDYSFGEMLEAIFRANPKVVVRRRAFHDALDFGVWCRELAALQGPIYLVVAAHGGVEGIAGHHGLVSRSDLAQALAPITSLRLVHFSACEILGGPVAEEIFARRPPGDALVGVSGYTVTVDWMASALSEFLYLDLILNRGLDPARAAQELVRSLDFADDETTPGSVVPAAHFRFVARGATGE